MRSATSCSAFRSPPSRFPRASTWPAPCCSRSAGPRWCDSLRRRPCGWRRCSSRREGAGHRALALALALESILVVACAAILALGVVSDPRVAALAPWARHLAWAAPVLAIAAWLAIGVIGRRGGHERLAPARTAGPLSAVFVLDLVFFMLAALSLRLLCGQPGALPLPAWCGWFALAWALGYVTPGAPAGLGLREAVLAIGLSPVLGEAQAFALALAYRLVTVAADAVLALAGFAMLRGVPARESAQAPP